MYQSMRVWVGHGVEAMHQKEAKPLKKYMYITKEKNCLNHTEKLFRVAKMLNLY